MGGLTGERARAVQRARVCGDTAGVSETAVQAHASPPLGIGRRCAATTSMRDEAGGRSVGRLVGRSPFRGRHCLQGCARGKVLLATKCVSRLGRGRGFGLAQEGNFSGVSAAVFLTAMKHLCAGWGEGFR